MLNFPGVEDVSLRRRHHEYRRRIRDSYPETTQQRSRSCPLDDLDDGETTAEGHPHHLPDQISRAKFSIVS